MEKYARLDAPPLKTEETAVSIVAFTDGACSCNGKRGARASWAVVWPDHGDHDDAGVLTGQATNNRGELMAIIRALEIARDDIDPSGLQPLTIHSDSMLAVNTVTTWMRVWKRRGWKKADGDPPANLDLLKVLDELVEGRGGGVVIKFVRAHTGRQDWASLHNDRVDRLARDALRAAVL